MLRLYEAMLSQAVAMLCVCCALLGQALSKTQIPTCPMISDDISPLYSHYIPTISPLYPCCIPVVSYYIISISISIIIITSLHHYIITSSSSSHHSSPLLFVNHHYIHIYPWKYHHSGWFNEKTHLNFPAGAPPRLLLVFGHRFRPEFLRDVDLRQRSEAGLSVRRTGKEQDRLWQTRSFKIWGFP